MRSSRSTHHITAIYYQALAVADDPAALQWKGRAAQIVPGLKKSAPRGVHENLPKKEGFIVHPGNLTYIIFQGLC